VLTDAPKADLQAITASLNGLSAAEVKETIARLSTSCLLVSGQNDPAVTFPVESAFTLPEQSHSIFFEQSGHFPMLDEGSRFNRLMADFLSLPSGESPRQLQLKDEWKRRVR
jgi:pimeloyl-ACP methyl ester carboxylesterase